jgi:hypothetical protein
MTVKEILIDWLKANGYDGLCNPDINDFGSACACSIDDPLEFLECGEYLGDCQTAYLWTCPGEKIRNCDLEMPINFDGEKCRCYRLTKQEG